MSQKENPTDKTNDKMQKDKNIFQKHPFVFLLIGALIISVLWGVMKSNNVERKLRKEFTAKVEEIQSQSALQLANTFSLAIRSELTRGNKEQAEQYMMALIRDESVRKVKLIDFSNKKIQFSTDKNEEGKLETDSFILTSANANVQIQEDMILSVAPIMDFTKQIAIVAIYQTRD